MRAGGLVPEPSKRTESEVGLSAGTLHRRHQNVARALSVEGVVDRQNDRTERETEADVEPC